MEIFWLGRSHLHQWKIKSNCSSHVVAQFMDMLFGVIHTMQNFIRNLTVSYSDTFKRLINVPRNTSSSLAGIYDERDGPNYVVIDMLTALCLH